MVRGSRSCQRANGIRWMMEAAREESGPARLTLLSALFLAHVRRDGLDGESVQTRGCLPKPRLARISCG